MLEFVPFASSSAGCCYALRREGSAPLLIDAGLSFGDIQKALDYRVDELIGALISHGHGDHCKAVHDLLARGIDCYASVEAWAHILRRGEFVHARALFVGQPQKIGSWLVTPFDAVHDAPGVLGFVIDSIGGERLLYLTDSAYSRHRFEGLTHIAIECNYSEKLIQDKAIKGDIYISRAKRTIITHMSLERLLDMLAANDLSKVVEIWLLHLSDENSDEAMFKRTVQAATGKPVFIAPKRSVF